MPNNFHQTPRLLIDEIGIDTFVCTVSPVDRLGYFSFGIGNDYSTKVARATKRLIVEVKQNVPRVYGAAAELHVLEVDAIVENNVPLLELPIRGPAPEDEVFGSTIAGLCPTAPASRWASARCLSARDATAQNGFASADDPPRPSPALADAH